jgi:translation initiation factor 2B subunit (eIF-2B alpha/beta/delta family)
MLNRMPLSARATALAADRDAGASEVLARLLPLLEEAIVAGPDQTLAVARIVCAAQPAMAPLWHACAAAAAEITQPGRFARRRAELERAPRALARAASAALRDLLTGERTPLLLTVSFSASVAQTLAAVARTQSFQVACGEGRPRFEGRRLARDLHTSGIDVTLVVDAAVTALLPQATAVVVGADAISADRWINKIGTFGLAAAAASSGVAVYVIASRDKFVPRALEPHIRLPLNPADEIWPDGPLEIHRRNIYFEATPSDLATLYLSDGGAISYANLPEAVERGAQDIQSLLARL